MPKVRRLVIHMAVRIRCGQPQHNPWMIGQSCSLQYLMNVLCLSCFTWFIYTLVQLIWIYQTLSR